MGFTIARTLCACFLAGAVLAGAPAHTTETLELEQAIARTLEAHPALVAHGLRVEVAEGHARQAALPPNPELGVEVEDFLGTGPFRGARAAEATVTLGFLLERGLRERLVASARADVALRRADAELARLDAVAETARRFVVCLAEQARLEQARAAVELAAATRDAVRRRIAAALAPEAELARAEAELARAELAAEGVEHELRAAYRRLSAQWGALEPDFRAVAGALVPVHAEPYERLAARLEASPELARFATRRRLDEARIRLEEARRRRGWRVHAGLRRIETGDDFALVAGLTVPLGFRDDNSGAIAAARAEAAATDAEAAAVHAELRSTLYVLREELEHHVHVGERLRSDVIPRLAQAAAETERAFEAGRYGYLELRAARTDLAAARGELLDADVEAHLLLIELERLTGGQATLPAAGEDVR